jgi:hypothetical protein
VIFVPFAVHSLFCLSLLLPLQTNCCVGVGCNKRSALHHGATMSHGASAPGNGAIHLVHRTLRELPQEPQVVLEEQPQA